jgi:hypothetical protein
LQCGTGAGTVLLQQAVCNERLKDFERNARFCSVSCVMSELIRFKRDVLFYSLLCVMYFGEILLKL